MRLLMIGMCSVFVFTNCGKGSSSPEPPPPPPAPFRLAEKKLNNLPASDIYYSIDPQNAQLQFRFNAPVDRNSINAGISFRSKEGTAYTFSVTYSNNDSIMLIKPSAALPFITKFTVSLSNSLKSADGIGLTETGKIDFVTKIDSSRKFPTLSDDELLTKVQQQTFKYFWDFAHPISGLARERSNGDANLVTSGGSGFGIMAIVTGIERGFVTRADGLSRMQKIVGFLKNTAKTFHGAYPHWLDGTTGNVIPFSANDNGADLVETSYLVQGLLTARQYFNGADVAETDLRNDINVIWNRVEWSWFRKETNENVLYWHWSPDKAWQINLPVRGWNESLITYVLAASSTTHAVPKIVYDNGWASNGGMKNGKTFFGIQLPLGPDFGGPLFLEHYSFLGIKPVNLVDAYADYALQTKNHTLINYSYCVANPNKYGYSDSVWGLTASDIEGGYKASSPTNDAGFIAPTAALSSFPFTPVESMKALKFFYYVLGDKLWKEYGFIDAFSLTSPWFAGSFLAIDQGPVIIMIENYRSGLLWNLFTSCPEIKTGMGALGFTAPYL
ncbi:MAG TPA: glucoamylase family protein [Chitinophagaceae bacterium]|nr:glucoamylase family protein [Chitinophagaceae bacterium]